MLRSASHSNHMRRSIGFVLLVLAALGLFLFTFLRPWERVELSADQIASCVWQTSCWHEQYYEAFVRDGLIDGMPSEGDLIGLIAYRIEAISTQDLFTFFTILFSVLVFLAGLQYGRMQDRRAHTLDVVMGIFHADSLANANVKLSRINLDVKEHGRTLDGSISGEDDAAIITILDYYEFICQGVFEGSLSRRAVRDVRGGAMRTTYEACQQYISDRRESLERPRLYWALERFVKDVVRDKDC